MRRVSSSTDRLPTLGEIYRAQHSAWLTWALSSGEEFPRIPTRRADAGGFAKILARSNGRALTERWWEIALRRIKL
jgi:hypothetical protein